MIGYNLPLVVEWAKERNIIEGSTPAHQMLKLIEETGELAAGIARNNKELMADSVGDVLVVLTILCEQLNLDLQECYRKAYVEIKDRKGRMENNVFIKEEDLQEG